MRYSEFRELVDEVFGASVGRSLVSDLSLDALGDRTAARALQEGEEPRAVWRALCDAMGVPGAQRWGDDRRRVRVRRG